MRAELIFVIAWIGLFVGCGPHEEISRYSITVPEGPSNLQPPRGEPVNNAMAVVGPSRMLAAIVPRGKQTWFFKLVGPPEAVAKQEREFEALVKSVRFASDTAIPIWELPSGWRQRGGSGMRLATVEIEEGERNLEITVIPLETMGELDDYVMANINRWRVQLNLAPLAEIKLDDDGQSTNGIREFKLSDGTVVTMVNLVSPGVGSPAATPGFDMANHPSVGERQPGTGTPPGDDELTLTYATPDGWRVTGASGMRRAAFEVADGEQKVEITVISLAQSGGQRLANVNRWRNQIKLSDTTAEQLSKDLQTLSLAERSGDYVELFGPEASQRQMAILAVLADVEKNTWFFKLMGDANLARRERERFQTFVQSVKFSPNVDGAADE